MMMLFSALLVKSTNFAVSTLLVRIIVMEFMILSVVIAKLCLKTVTEFLLICAKLISVSCSFYNNYCHLLGNECFSFFWTRHSGIVQTSFNRRHFLHNLEPAVTCAFQRGSVDRAVANNSCVRPSVRPAHSWAVQIWKCVFYRTLSLTQSINQSITMEFSRSPPNECVKKRYANPSDRCAHSPVESANLTSDLHCSNLETVRHRI